MRMHLMIMGEYRYQGVSFGRSIVRNCLARSVCIYCLSVSVVRDAEMMSKGSKKRTED
jgi:hypothetical protein